MYKEALALLQPNFELEYPLTSLWSIRKGERQTFATDQISVKTKTTVLSTFSGTKQQLKFKVTHDFPENQKDETFSERQSEVGVNPEQVSQKYYEQKKEHLAVIAEEKVTVSPRRPTLNKKQEIPVKANSYLNGLQKRNEDQNNPLLELGGNFDEPNRGKGVVKGTRAAGHADVQDYFPMTKNKPLPEASYNQEYPAYKREDVDRFNDLKEETLKREAVQSVKDGASTPQGKIINTLFAKQKVDRKFSL